MRRSMIVLGAVLALGLAACGGGEAEGPADESPAGRTADPSPTADVGTEDAGGDDVDAQAVGEPAEPAKVTYRMTGEGTGDTGDITLSWDPPRFAMIYDEGKMVITDEGTLFCDPGGEGCFRMGSAEQGAQMADGLGPFLGFTSALQEGELLPDARTTGEAEIAGRTATCATYDASAYDPSAQGEAEYCFDPESGLMLRWTGTDSEGNSQTFEAVEVGQPEESDFEPTGPVQEMPQGGGG